MGNGPAVDEQRRDLADGRPQRLQFVDPYGFPGATDDREPELRCNVCKHLDAALILDAVAIIVGPRIVKCVIKIVDVWIARNGPHRLGPRPGECYERLCLPTAPMVRL